jgi:large subunit ribosomal protein L21
MYAIVRTGSKQYMVKPGDKFVVEKLEGEKNSTILLDDVLLISDGEELLLGKPNLENTKVECEILSQARTKKTIVFKFKKRKRYMRKKGHRQELTMLNVKSISSNDKVWNNEQKQEIK